jgi:hypothetical protein
MTGFIDTFIYNHLRQFTISDCLRLAPFLTGLRASSFLLWLTRFWLTNRSFLLGMTNDDWILTEFSSDPITTDSLFPIFEWTRSESESYITTDGQSASLSWNKAPVWGLRPDLYYYQTVAGLLMWSVLSDERTGLSFKTAPSPRQRSHFRVRVPWD